MSSAPVQSTFAPSTSIVTGSDSGIGRATAVALAEAGLDVGVTWHEDEQGAEGTASEVRALGRRAALRRLDLSQLPDAADVVDELFLTMSPKVVGGAAALTIVAGRELVEPREPTLVSVAEAESELFTRWRFRASGGR